MPLVPQITSSGGGLYPASSQNFPDEPIASNLFVDRSIIYASDFSFAADGVSFGGVW